MALVGTVQGQIQGCGGEAQQSGHLSYHLMDPRTPTCKHAQEYVRFPYEPSDCTLAVLVQKRFEHPGSVWCVKVISTGQVMTENQWFGQTDHGWEVSKLGNVVLHCF